MNETIKFIIIFSIAQFINVMLNTFKTIVMYDKNKLTSSLINAVTYGFYTIIVVFMAGEMALWLKILLTAITNFFGVWLSMIIMDFVNIKFHKDNLWVITATANHIVTPKDAELLMRTIENSKVSYTAIPTSRDGECVFTFYAYTQAESEKVKEIIQAYNMKYSIQESILKL